MPKRKPDGPEDEIAVALFANAHRCAALREEEWTERAAELVEWLSSQGWAALVALHRAEEWDRLAATLAALDAETLRTACRWAVVELSRLEPEP